MQTSTIGFTQKSAEQFFGLLRSQGVQRLIDVRIHNVSQLAGFAKKNDLNFFLRELCQADYLHLPELAPTASLLKIYKNREMPWDEYASRFIDLMEERKIDQTLNQELFEDSCLLCSEHQPHFCHRRLILEYLKNRWQTDMTIVHLV